MTRSRDEILSQVLSLPPTQRLDELRRLCGSDRSLLGELNTLISAYDEDPDFLQRPLSGDPAPFPPGTLPGQIGRYPILSELGRGGTGVVYKALDPALGRNIAIKVLLDPAKAGIDRIRREARLLATLNHPNIATVFSFESESEFTFLTMELITGRSLADRIDEGPLDDLELADIARQVALALHASHSVGIEHRDLTPQNVFLVSDGGVKVLDFGISTRRPGPTPSAQTETPEGATSQSPFDPGPVQGTPGFISPEVLLGERVDHRSDIWSFGCILYYCLTCTSLFRRDTVLRTLAATLEHVIDLSLLRETHSPELVSILQGCLERDVSARLDSFGEIATRLLHVSTDSGMESNRSITHIRPLPRPLSSFVGREADIEQISLRLRLTRLFAITGPGGVGKTRLALEVGHRFQAGSTQTHSRKPDVVFVELVRHESLSSILAEIARALLLEESQEVTRSIETALSGREAILILDNCEHVLDEIAPLVEQFLSACPRLRVLATGREPLGIDGEEIYRLERLDYPSEESDAHLADILSLDAVRLFVDRAKKSSRDFEVTEEMIGPISRICQQLDGLPLALELAAARVAHFSPQEILDRIEDRFQFLTRTARTGAPHHRTLRMVMDHGFDLLSDQERRVFCLLSVFAGGWTLAAAEAICADESIERWQVLDILTRLVDKSLVDATTESRGQGKQTRYRMLTTIRSYGLDRLHESDVSESTMASYRAHFVWFAEHAADSLHGPEQATWFARLDDERLNLRDLLTNGPVGDESAARIALSLADTYWKTRPEGEYLGSEIIATILQDRTLDRSHRCLLLRHQAMLLRFIRPREAEETAQLAIVAAEELEDPLLLALSRDALALMLKTRGEYLESLGMYEGQLEYYRATGNRFREAQILTNMASIYLKIDRPDDALETLEAAILIHRELGDSRNLSICLHGLASYHFLIGNLDKSSELLDESIQLRIRIRDVAGRVTSTTAKAEVEAQRGDTKAAIGCLLESLTLSGTSSPTATLNIIRSLAGLELNRGNVVAALELRGAEGVLLARMGQSTTGLEQTITEIRTSNPSVSDGDAAFAISKGELCEDLEAMLRERLGAAI